MPDRGDRVARTEHRARRLWPSWVLLAVVLAVSLLLGSRAGSAGPPAAQRAAHLESEIRCPSCSGLSVAQSDASTAVAVRGAIREQVAAGRSDADIESYLLARYGPSILLSPPTTGLSFLVWLLPVLVVGLAAGGVAWVLARRRSTAPPSWPPEPTTGKSIADDERLVAEALARGEATPAERRP